MQVTVKGKHMEVTPALRSHSEEKAVKLDKYLTRIQTVDITLSIQKGWQTVEVNVHSDLVDLRAQERSHDMYEAIDLVMKKLEKQVRRFKEKLKSHPHRDLSESEFVMPGEPITNEPAEDEEAQIVRVKHPLLKPLSPLEAADQMELVGHDFFVFLNAENDQVNVLYRRNDGNYGLIQPNV
jgi:putative sigma-54 modulation protein